LAQPPLWGKRAALVEPLKVTVDRRAVDPEPTGGLAFGNALLYGLYYLGAQIYGVGFHVFMMLGDATSVQAAVEPQGGGEQLQEKVGVNPLYSNRGFGVNLSADSKHFNDLTPMLW
jgi:hypothetical protein